MYFILLNFLLIRNYVTAETIEEGTIKNNITSFLPYTLRAEVNKDMDINTALQRDINEAEINNYAVNDTAHALNLFEKKNDGINQLPDSNNWKRFAAHFPTQATIHNQQELRYAEHSDYSCNNKNMYSNHNYLISFISQPVLLFIHLGILLYTLFGTLVLFHRLLYSTPHNLSTLNQSYFYKTDF